MTLVVRALRERVPMMVGDVLMTGKVRRDLDNRPPTVSWDSENAPLLFQGDEGPAGLRQKILCNERLVVGWTGLASLAAKFVSRLDEVATTGKVSLNTVLRVLKDVPKDGTLGLTGWLMDGNTLRSFNVGQVGEYKLANGLELTCIGSGAPYIGKAAAIIGNRRVKTGGEREPDPAKDALELSLFLIIDLLLAELAHLDTLKSFFGGAYEVAGLGPEGFGKLQDIEYVFWNAIVDDDNDFLLPMRPREFFRLGYLSDLLVVRATRDASKYREGDFETEIFNVRPIHRDLPSEETELFSCPANNASLQTHIVSVDEHGKTYNFGFVSGLWDEDDRLIWAEKGKQITFDLQPRLHRKMATFMKHALGKDAPTKV